MKSALAWLLALGFAPFGFTQTEPVKPEPQAATVTVSPFKPLLFGDDHNSEGFLVPLDDGTLRLIFRVDPGTKGDHVGTDGYIAQVSYDPRRDTWGEATPVYNHPQYDDRNIHGGITRAGRIVVFFRRFDGRTTDGVYFITSDDKGRTWSDPQTYDKTGGMVGTGQMFFNPDLGKYSIMYRTDNRNEILFSDNGSSWNESALVANDPKTDLTEIAGAWAGNNQIVALIRDDQRKYGHPLLQVASRDNGRTWTPPAPTNIPPKQHWGAAPQLIYDQKRDLLIALNSDRYSRPNEQNSLFIYTARPADVIGNPQGWVLQHELKRPWAALGFEGNRPLNQNFYGYPTIAPINENEYLVVFTERAVMQGTEQADLYYFRLLLK